jgi:hypothetical protein
MTHITLKSQIDQSKLDILLAFLNSCGFEAEINVTKARTATKSSSKSAEKHELFSKTFGIWKDRDIDIKQIRQQAHERRTHANMVEDGTL